MSETWYVYRYSLADTEPDAIPMLKAPKTKLILTPGEPNWGARFELMEQPVEVEMVADPTTDAWYGMDQSGHLHFRWSRVVPGGMPVLVGQVFDERTANKRRDFFVATRSSRTRPLPQQNQRYDFAECHLTPYLKKRVEPWKDISIRLSARRIEIGQPNVTYSIDDDGIKTYGGGLQVTGWHGDESLELWLLPAGTTGGHLVTGCHSHWPPGTHTAHARTTDLLKRPLDPDCVNGTHLC